MSRLPSAAYAASLAGFDRMTVARLLALLRHLEPEEAFRVVTGEVRPPALGIAARLLADEQLRAAWAASADRWAPDRVWERCQRLGVEVTHLGDGRHPALFANDPLPPAVLFSLGDRSLLDGRRVGIVGTRNVTATGRHVAETFGRGLAAAGVHVVSGLARGVDGFAHRGVVEVLALDANAAGRPIGVVACGLDIVYPREHRRLWSEVAANGLLVSEWPPGMPPVAYRFPLRNRIIAAFSEVVVVIESRETGGSLITAAQATERGVPVMAVPGNTRERTSNGVNGLLRDGAPPAIDVDDVLVALSMEHAHTGALFADRRARPMGRDLVVHEVVVARPVTIGDVADELGISLVEAAMSLARLEQSGWLTQVDGWFEPLGSPPR